MRPIIGSLRPNANILSKPSLNACSVAFQGFSSKASDVRSASGADAESSSLGIYTKSSPTFERDITPETASALALRVDRYLLQNVIRGLFVEEYLAKRKSAGDVDIADGEYLNIPLDDYNELNKIVKCSRTRIRQSVTVHKSIEGKCFYSGIVACSSVWACPVCAAKIQERRRVEVAAGMDYAYREMKKQCSMITLTFPHNALQSCSELREKQKLALADFRKGGTWTRKMKKYGYEGLIRSLEITHGNNGWHPHTHELWIMDYFNQDEEKEFKSFILGQWERACKKHGLIPRGRIRDFRKHSIDIKFSASNSDYLAKVDNEKNLHWGADREIAKASGKISNKSGAPKKGLHPFQLVDGFSKGNFWMGAAFLEYVKAMKGARQLYWSPGLKKRCKIDELTDKELIEREEESAMDLTDLNMFAWNKVLEKKARAEILNIAETEGLEGLLNWFKSHDVDLFAETKRVDFRSPEFDDVVKADYVPVEALKLDFFSD